MKKILELSKVNKTYNTGMNQVQALSDVSVTLNEGEFLTIMGSSGSGKSTLLNCISSIDKPTSGCIKFLGQDIVELNQNTLADYRANNISFIFQNYNLIDTLNVYENIVLPLQIRGDNVMKEESDINKILKSLEIYDLKKRFIDQLSGGQQQRVAAARAIISKAKLLIADEPTGALDSVSSSNLLELFVRLNDEFNLSIIMVTHDPYSAIYSQKIIFLKDGQIVKELSKDSFSSRDEYLDAILETQRKISGKREM
ncbi:MAG TPA: ABC transporter ATP-binding protein [Epulopiscium sp.]|nr:ABC transporter ATP-binding protein [Candidatus Epulonipiscium sp.]